ncbi:MAG: 4-hydroxy-tetrahydrodipicolinate reductase [Myxococcota bacterium]
MSDAHRVLVVGALGKMGERVRAALANEPSLVLGAALEGPGHPGVGQTLEDGVIVTDDAAAAASACDVAIDFSVPAATLAIAEAAADAGTAYVTGTTGFSEAELTRVDALATRIPWLRAANFSLAVNVLAYLTREAARLLGPDYDAEIVELHHALKRDAPSGTALRLAEVLAEGREHSLADHLVLERAGEIGARPEAAIGVQTLRGGDNAGEHTVFFVGGGERIELVHRSHTRDHFAAGAVRCAAWIVGKPPGRYAVEEVFGLPTPA